MTVYGPVPSRRLGHSLGINDINDKACSYSCVYCQLGNTTHLSVERQCFCDPQILFNEVEQALKAVIKRGETIDYLTFVADGEPTLSATLGQEIDILKPLGVKIAVITNASLIWCPDVREELARADLVSLKVDTVCENVWKRIDRPHKSLRFSEILDGVRAFSEAYDGKLITDTMLIDGLNDDENDLEQLAGFLGEIGPEKAYLAVPTRPPAVDLAAPAPEFKLNLAYQIVSKRVRCAELLTGYEGNEFSSTGDAVVDLLNITSVHPMREDAVKILLDRSGEDWGVVDRLVRDGRLQEAAYAGHQFYLRTRKA